MMQRGSPSVEVNADWYDAFVEQPPRTQSDRLDGPRSKLWRLRILLPSLMVAQVELEKPRDAVFELLQGNGQQESTRIGG